MPARSKAKDETAEAGLSPVPGKSQSQVDAEAPVDAETEAAWNAEYESRVPMAMYETGEPAAEEAAETEATGNPRDWTPGGKS